MSIISEFTCVKKLCSHANICYERGLRQCSRDASKPLYISERAFHYHYEHQGIWVWWESHDVTSACGWYCHCWWTMRLSMFTMLPSIPDIPSIMWFNCEWWIRFNPLQTVININISILILQLDTSTWTLQSGSEVNKCSLVLNSSLLLPCLHLSVRPNNCEWSLLGNL